MTEGLSIRQGILVEFSKSENNFQALIWLAIDHQYDIDGGCQYMGGWRLCQTVCEDQTC